MKRKPTKRPEWDGTKEGHREVIKAQLAELTAALKTRVLEAFADHLVKKVLK
jgi:hypothetical protein